MSNRTSNNVVALSGGNSNGGRATSNKNSTSGASKMFSGLKTVLEAIRDVVSMNYNASFSELMNRAASWKARDSSRIVYLENCSCDAPKCQKYHGPISIKEEILENSARCFFMKHRSQFKISSFEKTVADKYCLKYAVGHYKSPHCIARAARWTSLNSIGKYITGKRVRLFDPSPLVLSAVLGYVTSDCIDIMSSLDDPHISERFKYFGQDSSCAQCDIEIRVHDYELQLNPMVNKCIWIGYIYTDDQFGTTDLMNWKRDKENPHMIYTTSGDTDYLNRDNFADLKRNGFRIMDRMMDTHVLYNSPWGNKPLVCRPNSKFEEVDLPAASFVDTIQNTQDWEFVVKSATIERRGYIHKELRDKVRAYVSTRNRDNFLFRTTMEYAKTVLHEEQIPFEIIDNTVIYTFIKDVHVLCSRLTAMNNILIRSGLNSVWSSFGKTPTILTSIYQYFGVFSIIFLMGALLGLYIFFGFSFLWSTENIIIQPASLFNAVESILFTPIIEEFIKRLKFGFWLPIVELFANLVMKPGVNPISFLPPLVFHYLIIEIPYWQAVLIHACYNLVIYLLQNRNVVYNGANYLLREYIIDQIWYNYYDFQDLPVGTSVPGIQALPENIKDMEGDKEAVTPYIVDKYYQWAAYNFNDTEWYPLFIGGSTYIFNNNPFNVLHLYLKRTIFNRVFPIVPYFIGGVNNGDTPLDKVPLLAFAHVYEKLINCVHNEFEAISLDKIVCEWYDQLPNRKRRAYKAKVERFLSTGDNVFRTNHTKLFGKVEKLMKPFNNKQRGISDAKNYLIEMVHLNRYLELLNKNLFNGDRWVQIGKFCIRFVNAAIVHPGGDFNLDDFVVKHVEKSHKFENAISVLVMGDDNFTLWSFDSGRNFKISSSDYSSFDMSQIEQILMNLKATWSKFKVPKSLSKAMIDEAKMSLKIGNKADSITVKWPYGCAGISGSGITCNRNGWINWMVSSRLIYSVMSGHKLTVQLIHQVAGELGLVVKPGSAHVSSGYVDDPLVWSQHSFCHGNWLKSTTSMIPDFYMSSLGKFMKIGSLRNPVHVCKVSDVEIAQQIFVNAVMKSFIGMRMDQCPIAGQLIKHFMDDELECDPQYQSAIDKASDYFSQQDKYKLLSTMCKDNHKDLDNEWVWTYYEHLYQLSREQMQNDIDFMLGLKIPCLFNCPLAEAIVCVDYC